MADIALQQVARSFGDNHAIKGISLEIHDGEFVVLLGPTGAGKTTTLRLIAGLEKADAGNIMIGGEKVNDLPPSARDTTPCTSRGSSGSESSRPNVASRVHTGESDVKILVPWYR